MLTSLFRRTLIRPSSISASLTLVLLLGLSACADREQQARYANFRTRFKDIRKDMSLSELISSVGEPDRRAPVFPGGPCSEFSTATQSLTYELRASDARHGQNSVAMAFIACVDGAQKVAGTSFVEF